MKVETALAWLNQIVHHCCNTDCSLVPVACKSSSTPLDLFQFIAVLFSIVWGAQTVVTYSITGRTRVV